MKIKLTIHLIAAIILTTYVHTRIPVVLCNPVTYDPLLSMAPMPLQSRTPLQAPMMMGPQFDPYNPMIHASAQYMLAPPFMPLSQLDSHRRSLPGIYREDRRSTQPKELTDEQKALEGLPVSFIEPEAPSTITERISDSFSALGEGVKNHFRSLTENFSDTIDDLKDAWRMSDNKREKQDRFKALEIEFSKI